MAPPPNRPPILGSFEDIGEQIKQEITKLPGDIVGQALESVGMNVGSGKKSQQNTSTPMPGATGADGSAYKQMDQTTDQKAKKEIARKALEEIMKKAPGKQESIWEKIMKEEDQKKEAAKHQRPQSVALPSSGARKVPGMKSAIKAKQQGSEIGKNAKQD